MLPAERAERLDRRPVRLADDPDAVPLRFQQAADQRHAEARMVDVGVARDQDDVARIPAELVHLRTGHGQERRGGRAAGTFGNVREEIGRGVHGPTFYRNSYGRAPPIPKNGLDFNDLARPL